MVEQTNEVLKFAIGDKVVGIAFTDSSGKFHPQTEVLTVAEQRIITSCVANGLAPYQRIKAIGAGRTYVEAAARFFVKEASA